MSAAPRTDRGRPIAWLDGAVLLLLSLIVLAPLANQHYFKSHIGTEELQRLCEIRQSIHDGVLYARWYPDFAQGLGLPMMIFFPPLVLYLAVLPMLAGLPSILALKLLVALGTWGAAFGAYFLGREGFGRTGGLLAGAAYLFAPYHLLNLFVRGDLPDSAMAIFPWLLWAYLRLSRDGGLRRLIAAGAVQALLLLTHNVSALTMSGLAALFGLVLLAQPGGLARWRRALELAGGAALGLALSCFFWLPAFVEKQHVKIEVMTKGYMDFRKHFIAFRQFFDPYWGYGFSIPGTGDTVSFQIGNAQLVLGALGLILLWRRRRRMERLSWWLAAFFLSALLLVALLMTAPSMPLWNHLPLIRFLQFPLRLLSLASLAAALLAATLAARPGDRPAEKLHAPWLTGLGLLLMAGQAAGWCHFYGYLSVRSADFTPQLIRSLEGTTMTGEYVPRWVVGYPKKEMTKTLEAPPAGGFTRQQMEQRVASFFANPEGHKISPQTLIPVNGKLVRPQTAELLEGRATLEDYSFRTGRVSFTLDAETGCRVRLNHFWYPGWQLTVDGQPQPLGPETDSGLMVFRAPPGQHQVTIRFGSTPLRRGAAAVGWGSLAGTGLALLLSRRRRSKLPQPGVQAATAVAGPS